MVVDMSRGPVRSASEICADCGASDPKWASVNRGVLVCDECCSVHRSLGRHISQIKSLKKGSWAPSLLAYVRQLASSGANGIWEYSLVDPSLNKSCRRKPSHRDPLHPTKADFIRAKYQFLAFTKKYKDEDSGTITDLSKQLHSSVRTNNLETSLRLLSQGADPNYLHQDRGNRALHVAAQSGQSLQVELLVVYGADPGAVDNLGKTPADYAGEQHADIAQRLIECQYELTDTLAYYLCSRKPEHRNGHHYIIPEMADSVDVTELAKAARKKLQALPHNLFEELAMDVYDEVDRRENDAIWIATKNPAVSDRQAVPFLPVNPDFSSTRNQGRQKLARFNAREFATLVIDILSDAKRRQQGVLNPPALEPSKPIVDGLKGHPRQIKTSSFSDDEPAYDSVASDEDYSSVGDRASIKEATIVEHPGEHQVGDGSESPRLEKSPLQEEAVHNNYSDEVELRMSLASSQNKISELVSINQQLQREVAHLKTTISQLSQENAALKSSSISKSSSEERSKHSTLRQPASSSLTNGSTKTLIPLRFGAAGSTGRNRPHSMVETSKSRMTAIPPEVSGSLHSTLSGSLNRLASKPLQPCKGGDPLTDSPNADNDSLYDNDQDAAGFGKDFPSQESITANTENITKKIQELLVSARENKLECYIPCSDRITQAVDTMIDLFPVKLEDSSIQAALSKLKSGAMQLCQEAKRSDVNGHIDSKAKTQSIMQCAYDIAKAAKVLVTSIQRTVNIT
ncbi:ARF GTPase-activating protein GIT2-like isoform X2 [Watersipora subatra]|uniref:ARF GTPase-activating protein GIT2-like isoform X2 n=1 Tax=Watersipora subatra TaxID=2589382 RepID=UPI00355BD34C